MTKITNYTDAETETTKRFYPPFKLESKCPKCGEVHIFNGNDDYILEAVIGQPQEISFSCETCDLDWTESIRMSITTELLNKKRGVKYD